MGRKNWNAWLLKKLSQQVADEDRPCRFIDLTLFSYKIITGEVLEVDLESGAIVFQIHEGESPHQEWIYVDDILRVTTPSKMVDTNQDGNEGCRSEFDEESSNEEDDKQL